MELTVMICFALFRWNFNSFNFWILSNNLYVVKGQAKFSVSQRMGFRWVFPNPINLDICSVNYRTGTEGIQWEKAALIPLVSSWGVSFAFLEETPDLLKPLQQTNEKLSQLQNKKNLNLLITILFSPFTYWTKLNLPAFINRRWEWIIFYFP